MKSKVSDRITLVQNGIDSTRGNATMYINPKNNGGSGINRMDNNSHSGNYDKTRLTFLGPQTYVYTMTHHKILCLARQVLSIDTLRYDREMTVMMTMIKQNEITQF